MANAQETLEAPVKKENKWALEDSYLDRLNPDSENAYDTNKKYVYRLAAENMVRGMPVIDMRTKRPVPHKKFKPYQNIVLTSQIVWKGKRTTIRYYDGCDTIFVADQPKEKEQIDQLIRQTRRRDFLDGAHKVEGYDKMLLFYLDICGWNVDSPFRTTTATGIFYALNPDKKATADTAKMDRIEEALQLAKSAEDWKMKIHSAYLGISDIDPLSDNELTPSQMRAAYRKYAMENSETFISSFGNKNIETKYFIDKALLDGKISNKLNPNKAAWGNSGTEICDISGLQLRDAIAQKLFDFGQTEEGQDFVIQLKAIYNN